MKVIGLTGGIGSGKSTVSKFLEAHDYPVIDADQIAREVTALGSSALTEIAEVFGREVLAEDGSLNRKKLGEIVFADSNMKELLDDITHKRILERIAERLADCEGKGETLAFIDAALLFETGLDQQADTVWLVETEEQIRIKRIMERDSLNETEVRRRINVQMPQEEKRRRSDEILDNSGTKDLLFIQIERLLGKIRQS